MAGKWVGIAEAAALLGLSHTQAYRWAVVRGRVRTRNASPGSSKPRWEVDAADLGRFAATRDVPRESPPGWVDSAAAATLLGRSGSQLRFLANRGELRAVKVPQARGRALWYFDPADLLRHRAGRAGADRPHPRPGDWRRPVPLGGSGLTVPAFWLDVVADRRARLAASGAEVRGL